MSNTYCALFTYSDVQHILCLFMYSDVQHILCCAFALFSSSCVPNVASFSGLSILIAPSVFSNVYSSVENKNTTRHARQ